MSSSQGFTFPPPPPPPPRQQQQQPQQPQQPQQYPPYGQSHNGKRGGRGASRGRGRGHGNRGGGRGGGHYAATPPAYSANTTTAPSPPVGYSPMNYAGFTAQPLSTTPTPGIPMPQYVTGSQQASGYPPTSTAFQSQAFSQPAAAQISPYQQGYNGLCNQSAAQTTQASSSSIPPYQHASSSMRPSIMGMHMPWGYGQPATGIHPGVQDGNGWTPQPYNNNGYGNHAPNGGHLMKPMTKRDHSSAFGKPQSTGPRTPAPPAVPSFGNPLPSKPPPPSDSTRALKKKKRQHNQLGLTPKNEEHESSEEEDGVDEESNFASRGGVGVTAPLKFSYRGRTATLQTPEDIAAWIEERKKRFPTQARVEEKKKAMEETKKAREEALKQKRESRKQEMKWPQKDNQGQDQHKASSDPVDAAAKATQKADKLRQKLLREQKRVAKAEAEAERARLKLEELQKEPKRSERGGTEMNGSQTSVAAEHVSLAPEKEKADGAQHLAETQMEAAEISSSSDVTNDSDWTSSSGSDDDSSSESDGDNDSDDSAPEEITSRRDGPERVPPPPRENIKKRVCRHFARNGRCLRGDKCNFLHELPERKANTKPAPQKGRQGLLQMLLGRQEEDDNHRVMDAIMSLGDQGVLDEPVPSESHDDAAPPADGDATVSAAPA